MPSRSKSESSEEFVPLPADVNYLITFLNGDSHEVCSFTIEEVIRKVKLLRTNNAKRLWGTGITIPDYYYVIKSMKLVEYRDSVKGVLRVEHD